MHSHFHFMTNPGKRTIQWDAVHLTDPESDDNMVIMTEEATLLPSVSFAGFSIRKEGLA